MRTISGRDRDPANLTRRARRCGAILTVRVRPGRTFMRYPGTVVVEFLDPILPGLKRDEFLARAERAIEEATHRIVTVAQEEQRRSFGRIPPKGE